MMMILPFPPSLGPARAIPSRLGTLLWPACFAPRYGERVELRIPPIAPGSSPDAHRRIPQAAVVARQRPIAHAPPACAGEGGAWAHRTSSKITCTSLIHRGGGMRGNTTNQIPSESPAGPVSRPRSNRVQDAPLFAYWSACQPPSSVSWFSYPVLAIGALGRAETWICTLSSSIPSRALHAMRA